MVDFPETRTLVDALLDEQRSLSAVEQFARLHEADALPQLAPRYRSLLPATPPARGQQYAFEVDLDKCSACKSCVAACHSLNGLDVNETWRTVGTLLSEDWRRPFQQTVTTACHHCVDPGCLNGCPVLAYEKDATTGIVRHLDDQCIGCQYCVLKCPYDVPRYSPARGIVRKCDMCSQRLAVNEAPACVQACPNEAIRISIIDQKQVRTNFRAIPALRGADLNAFLPASPDPALTVPTTRFVSRKPLPTDLVPADAGELRLQPGHIPLVWMLVLTQLGVGAFAIVPFSWAAGVPMQTSLTMAALGLAATMMGLLGSVLHLGKPLKAWRSFLGWRKSWLSREILAFGAFAPLAAVLTALCLRAGSPAAIHITLGLATAVTGLGAVLCSGMVYHDTRRALWLGSRSLLRFLGTAALLGPAAAWLCLAVRGDRNLWVTVALATTAVFKLAGEHRLLRRGESASSEETWPNQGSFDDWSLAHSAVLMNERLGLLTRVRIACGFVGGVLLPLAGLLPEMPLLAAAAAGAGLCLLGEFLERHLFFRCVVPPRMPGASGNPSL